MNDDSPQAPALEADPPAASASLVTDRLNRMLAEAAAAFLLMQGDRPPRSGGWTPERIRIFLETLADTGRVGVAAGAAGMARVSAYALRRRVKGRPFCHAWRGAVLIARQRQADERIARARKGTFRLVVRDGKVVAERFRGDNGFTLAMLDRLDDQRRSADGGTEARPAAPQLDRRRDIVIAGREKAAPFARRRGDARVAGEPGLLRRLADYLGRVAARR